MKVTYAVYVVDHAGWLECCPDYEGVFFGVIPAGGTYYSPSESDFGGHVEFKKKSAAQKFAAALAQSGDWVTRAGIEKRPTYAVTECNSSVNGVGGECG